MKLQKLVYCTHGWWLAINQVSMLSERPQVWRHGPVFASLYHTLKTYGHQAIPKPQLRYPNETLDIVRGDNFIPSYVEFVWEKYGHLSSFALSDMTHKAGTPWNKLASEYNFQVPYGLEIPDEYVRKEFSELYAQETVRHEEAATA